MRLHFLRKHQSPHAGVKTRSKIVKIPSGSALVFVYLLCRPYDVVSCFFLVELSDPCFPLTSREDPNSFASRHAGPRPFSLQHESPDPFCSRRRRKDFRIQETFVVTRVRVAAPVCPRLGLRRFRPDWLSQLMDFPKYPSIVSDPHDKSVKLLRLRVESEGKLVPPSLPWTCLNELSRTATQRDARISENRGEGLGAG